MRGEMEICNQICPINHDSAKEDYLDACMGDPSIPYNKYIEGIKKKLESICEGDKTELHRVVWSKGEIDTDNLGKHYSSEPLQMANIEALFKIAKRRNENLEFKEDAHFIKVEAPVEDIDYCETLQTNIEYPWEEEITLRTDDNLEIVKDEGWVE